MSIVEGHGEVEAVPILLRRIVATMARSADLEFAKPIRVARNGLLKAGELERAVELAARLAGAEGAILILLDADDDCPSELAPDLLERARAARPDRAIRVVLAKREFEAWFVAAAESLAGRRGLEPSLAAPRDAEGIRDAKGWLSDHMPVGQAYRATLDQPAFTAALDLDTAKRHSPSFDKLCRDIAGLIAETGQSV